MQKLSACFFVTRQLICFILGVTTVTLALSVLEAKTMLSYSWQEFLNRE